MAAKAEASAAEAEVHVGVEERVEAEAGVDEEAEAEAGVDEEADAGVEAVEAALKKTAVEPATHELD